MKRWTNGLSGREQAWPRLNLHDPAAENCGSSRQNSSRECGYPLSGRVTRKLKFRGCRHLVESPRPPVDSRHSYLLSSNSGAHSKTVPAAPYRHYAASQANLSITRSCGGRPAVTPTVSPKSRPGISNVPKPLHRTSETRLRGWGGAATFSGIIHIVQFASSLRKREIPSKVPPF
jgi:hypothetical protein